MIITHVGPSKVEATLAKIDTVADKTRDAIVSNPGKIEEYRVAQMEASEFRSAGYSGPVPPTVLSWAEAKGWTPQQAAEDVLAAAERMYAPLYRIRDLRLKAKEAVRNASSWSQIEVIVMGYEADIALLTQGVV